MEYSFRAVVPYTFSVDLASPSHYKEKLLLGRTLGPWNMYLGYLQAAGPDPAFKYMALALVRIPGEPTEFV